MSIPAESRLHQAEWLRRPEVQQVFSVLDGKAGRTRAVGGIVRDTILERLTAAPDVDMATELLPAEVMARAKAAGIPAYPTGIEHGTVTLRPGATTIEVTTLRRDIETDGRRAIVQFGTDWLADASRRDFTLNALYADMNGDLLDPVGGLADCLSEHVRFIGDPARRIAEDGLRVFRFFRFSASHGQQVFDGAGLEACAQAATRLGHLSAERVGAEMMRMLGLPRIAVTLVKMMALGLLELGPDVVQPLQAYERQVAQPNFSCRLALMLKSTQADTLQGRWRLSNEAIGAATALRQAAELLAQMALNEVSYYYAPHLADALDVAAAEAGWGEAGKAAVLEKLSAISPKPLPISGADLIERGFAPGPDLGAALKHAEKSWIESGFTLDPQYLLELSSP